MEQIKIIRDSRENRGWHFPNQKVKKLETGDYSIVGLEDFFTIERKGKVAEFAGNLVSARFRRELQRMIKMPHGFIFLEFTFYDLANFPYTSDVPKHKWGKIRNKGPQLVKLFLELQLSYRLPFLFVGRDGKGLAEEMFKKMCVEYKLK